MLQFDGKDVLPFNTFLVVWMIRAANRLTDVNDFTPAPCCQNTYSL
jgi:hypothetical protein